MVAFCKLLGSEDEKNGCLGYDEQGKENSVYDVLGFFFDCLYE
jgi:hypothetical protein